MLRSADKRIFVGSGIRDLLRAGGDDRNFGTLYGSVFTEVRILSSTTSVSGSATSTHTVSLPTGIQSGELLLLFASVQDDLPSADPSGWTALDSLDAGPATMRSYYRIADGSEGSTTTFSTSGSNVSAHAAVRIGGHNGTVPVITEAGDSSGGTSRDMPAFSNPSSRDSLVVLACGIGGGDSARNPTGYPSGYDYLQIATNQAGASNDAGIAVAAKKNVIAADDPGAFTYAGGGVAYVGHSVVVKG